jgi:hypothetical protein
VGDRGGGEMGWDRMGWGWELVVAFNFIGRNRANGWIGWDIQLPSYIGTYMCSISMLFFSPISLSHAWRCDDLTTTISSLTGWAGWVGCVTAAVHPASATIPYCQRKGCGQPTTCCLLGGSDET